jgi:hypothetical protein
MNYVAALLADMTFCLFCLLRRLAPGSLNSCTPKLAEFLNASPMQTIAS